MATYPVPQPEAGPHPTHSVSRRFLDDQLLRRAGYAIHARRRDETPVWTRFGKLFDHEDALAEALERFRVEAAKRDD